MAGPSMVYGLETEYSIYASEDRFDENGTALEDAVMDAMLPLQEEGFTGDGIEAVMADELTYGVIADAMVRAAFNDARIMGSHLAGTIGTAQGYGFLRNGARFYNDMNSTPEYSTPECSRPDTLLIQDIAGMRIEQMAADIAGPALGRRIDVYKKNSDALGNTYGCHENYGVTADFWKELITSEEISNLQYLVATFLIVRQVLCGAGKVGTEGVSAPDVPFQISQRLDFMTKLRGDGTTNNRPIIQCRKEPHADGGRWQRLHVIAGDSNICEASTYLKVGLTSLFLMMLQDPRKPTFALPVFRGTDERFALFARSVSRDPEMLHRFPVVLANRTQDGTPSELSAPEIFHHYVDRITAYAHEREYADDDERRVYLDVVRRAAEYLEFIRMGRSHRLYGILDWPTKQGILRHYLRKNGWKWDVAQKDLAFRRRLRVIVDHAFTCLRPESSLYHKLVKAGHITRLVSDADVERAISTPPPGRAELRSLILDRFSRFAEGMDWSVIKLSGVQKAFQLQNPYLVIDPSTRKAIEEAADPRDLVRRIHALKKERKQQRRQGGGANA